MKRRALPILVSLAGVCLIGLLIYGISTPAASRTIDDLVAKHQYPLAPDASRALPALGGSGHTTLASLKGKVVVLNFWASWCEPCKVEAPLLESFQSRLKAHDATVLGVTYLDNVPDSESFEHQYHLTYPNLRDTGGFAHSFGTDQLPETFVIDRHGHVVQLFRGEIEERFLNRALKVAETT